MAEGERLWVLLPRTNVQAVRTAGFTGAPHFLSSPGLTYGPEVDSEGLEEDILPYQPSPKQAKLRLRHRLRRLGICGRWCAVLNPEPERPRTCHSPGIPDKA